MNKKPEIEVFFADICGLCHKTMDYLNSRGLEFSAREVFWDKEAGAFADSETVREMYGKCGEVVDFVPQIFVNGTHIRGWKRLEPMIKSGAFDRLLAGGGSV